jgi:hypothetical protein
MEPRGESRGVSKQKWLDDRKKKIGKLLDSNGLDMSKAYMLDTQETAEVKYKKWEKEPAPHGWDGELISFDLSDGEMALFDQFDTFSSTSFFLQCVKNGNVVLFIYLDHFSFLLSLMKLCFLALLALSQ